MPKVALAFTILSAIHILTVNLYIVKESDLIKNNKLFSRVYLSIHGILFLVGLIIKWWWAILSTFIIIISLLLAPNSVGSNILFEEEYKKNGKVNEKHIMICHAVLMGIFSILVFILSIPFWIKVIIIFMAMLLHILVDRLSEDDIVITEITHDVFYDIFHKEEKTEINNEEDVGIETKGD